MKAIWTLLLFYLCAPAATAQAPDDTGDEKTIAKEALVEEIRQSILWYDKEKKWRPILIPEEVFGRLPLEELPIPGARDSIRLWIARQQKELSRDPAAETPCPYPGTASHRLTPGKRRTSLEEAMAEPLAVLLVSVGRTRVGVQPALGIYQYNEVSIVDILPGAGGQDQNPLSTRSFLSEGGEIEIEGTRLCSKSPWHQQAPRSGDTYLLLGSPDIYGIFNAVYYFRIDGGKVTPATYSELKLPAEPRPLVEVWAAAGRLRNAIPPVERFRLLPSGEKPHDPADDEIPEPAKRPSGPRGLAQADADVFCEEFQSLCDSSVHLAWRIQDACVAECTSWSHYGDKVSSCHWECGPAPTPPAREREPGAYGNGPRLAILNLRDGDTLSGRRVLRGFAMTFFGKVSLDLFWNGRRLHLRSLKRFLPSEEACSLPLGLMHSHCVKESGFEVEIDSTLLPNGPGRLAVVSTTERGWTSSLELDLVIERELKARNRLQYVPEP